MTGSSPPARAAAGPLRPLLLAVLLGPACASAPAAAEPDLARLKLPPGFRAEVYARVPQARSMALGAKGTLFVGTRGEAVYAVRDGRATKLLDGLNAPNGVAFRDGSLYVAEISRVLRYDGIEDRLQAPPRPVVVRDDFPKEGAHGWKFIRFGPDGKLYVPVGAPCNVCERDDPFASITRMSADGTALEVFARGVRNTVGFDWNPATGELWFTDNGRDMLGDDVPPDELNVAPRAGLDFGFPRCHGGDIPDPKFGRDRGCAGTVAPAVKFGAHVAALGMRFYRGTLFPPPWRGRIFVAQHGSWNRSVPDGYRVVAVDPATRTATTFAEGFLQGRRAWGRPVDVEELPDGSLLVSDDHAGAIYRITYR